MFILTHSINFPCGRKPEHPEKIHEFRQSVVWLFQVSGQRTHDPKGERSLFWRLRRRSQGKANAMVNIGHPNLWIGENSKVPGGWDSGTVRCLKAYILKTIALNQKNLLNLLTNFLRSFQIHKGPTSDIGTL
jgi:hypothetical protein